MNYSPEQIQIMLNHPILKQRMGWNYKLNFRYEVPGFAGFSNNGRTIYIDRKFRGCNRNILTALKRYIITKRVLMDIYRMIPEEAGRIASRELMVDTKAFLRGASSIKKAKNLPIDLDTTLYSYINSDLINKKLKRSKKRKETLDKAIQMDYDKQIERLKNVNRYFHERPMPGMSEGETNPGKL